MLKKTPLASAISSITVASAIAAGGAALPAYAADEMLEEVIVTGSRIRDANMISASPITTITDEEFDLAGTTRVEDLLNTFPQIAPSFDSFTVNPTTGFATADLYGLGTNRTLVLVNGHRLPAGGIRSQARDLNQIPAALVKRVEVLTGGASAVYGSDAMAGVVNFILDNDFEGVSLSGGYSGYQHENDNEYIQGLMTTSGFEFPTGGSGMGGEAYNFELALGAPIADGDGHAMAYFTWRENDPLLQAERDYSSCALSAAGTSCGGSSTAPNPNFFISGLTGVDAAGNPVFSLDDDFNVRLDDDGNPIPFSFSQGFANIGDDGTWQSGVGQLYNYAPINHFQRPDERWTLGGAISLEISPHFQPYLETMFANTNTRVQIAESGTFFVNALSLTCGDPFLGSFCADVAPSTEQTIGEVAGEDVTQDVFHDPTQPVTVYVGKRNVEGGPRISAIESSTFRAVAGTRGMINDDWNYDLSYVFSRAASSEANINDFLVSRIEPAILDCAPPAGPTCYSVFTPTGAVSPAAAAALGGAGLRDHSSEMTAISGYVTGILPFTVPSASEPVSLVAGLEYRKDEYIVDTDANMSAGNFAGAGGPRLPVSGSFSVNEIYFEAGVPLYDGGDVLQTLNLDLGYRYSDYDTSGGASTFKIGASAQVTDMFRFRGGFNRAIRAANVGELFANQQIALWSGEDPCAGPAAEIELTPAQCANTGVSGAQFGTIEPSPANQYNQFIGGNAALAPEEADTFTLGFVATPLDSLSVSLDYWDIEITDRIGTIGANTTLRFCAITGDPFLCDKVKRNASSGDLWLGSNPATSGQIINQNANFGDLHFRGVNLSTTYNMPLFAGNLTASLAGTYALENEIAPLPGVNPAATFDCVGVINTTCNFPQTPEWRHTARVTYAQDRFTGSVRWRYVGELDYTNTDGSAGDDDTLLLNNGGKVSAVNYIDLTGTVDVMENVNLVVGMNNVFDREPPMVGGTLILNANSIGGYDQLGRYLHVTFNLRY